MTKIRRIILMSEVGAGLLLGFVTGAAIQGIFGIVGFADPLGRTPFPLFRIASLATAALTIAVLHYHPGVQTWAKETVEEIVKVKWPTYEEARLSTLVVLVMVALITVLLGTFDWIFASLTSFIYT